MDAEIIFGLVTALSGIVGVVAGILKSRSENRLENLKIELSHHKDDLKSVLSEEELESLLEKINSIKATKKDSVSSSNKQAGSATKNFLVYIVPGVVALGVAGLYLYLLATNSANPEYVMPGKLESIMTILIGYLFGAGAANA